MREQVFEPGEQALQLGDDQGDQGGMRLVDRDRRRAQGGGDAGKSLVQGGGCLGHWRE
ncbi:MAG: hypothetical protein IT555_06280 [Acetobacteraceae bacterium]|nr:hypothetical protein [Acetobacteraceae bacterium]